MHILGACALMALARCRSVVPTAQGTSDWAGLTKIQGLQAKPALPLKKGMTNEGTNQEEMAPEAVLPGHMLLPGHMQRSKAFVGGTQDEALGELEEMFRETEDYEDEGSDKEEGLTTTASNDSDPLNGFCMVRVILCACGPGFLSCFYSLGVIMP